MKELPKTNVGKILRRLKEEKQSKAQPKQTISDQDLNIPDEETEELNVGGEKLKVLERQFNNAGIAFYVNRSLAKA